MDLTNQWELGCRLFACCSFRHGLRRATFLKEEGFGFPRKPTCLSLWERCRAATERAGSLLEGAGLPPCGKTEGAASYLLRIRRTFAQTCPRAAPSVTACAVPPSSGRKAFFILRAKQKRAHICTLFFGGRWWIRTTEVVDNRFTVCPLWPLGKPPIFACRNRGAGGRT